MKSISDEDFINKKLTFEFSEDTYGINLVVGGTIGQLSSGWGDWSEKDRINLIKSLIFTAPDCFNFRAKVEKMVKKLEREID